MRGKYEGGRVVIWKLVGGTWLLGTDIRSLKS
jgi:hypothetical protein